MFSFCARLAEGGGVRRVNKRASFPCRQRKDGWADADEAGISLFPACCARGSG